MLPKNLIQWAKFYGMSIRKRAPHATDANVTIALSEAWDGTEYVISEYHAKENLMANIHFPKTEEEAVLLFNKYTTK